MEVLIEDFTMHAMGLQHSIVEILKYVQSHWICYQYNIIFFWLLRYSVQSSSSVFIHNICSSYFFTISVLLNLLYKVSELFLCYLHLCFLLILIDIHLNCTILLFNKCILLDYMMSSSFWCIWRITLLRESGVSDLAYSDCDIYTETSAGFCTQKIVRDKKEVVLTDL